MSDQAANWSPATAAPQSAGWRGVAAIAGRYAVSVFGPVSISVAHFLASLIFLRESSPADFGLFSFLLVIVPFLSISVTGSLLLAPLGVMIAKNGTDNTLSTLCKAALIVAAATSILTFALLYFSHADMRIAALLAPYTGFMTLRFYGRGILFAENRPLQVMLSDIVYSGVLCAGLLLLLWSGRFGIAAAAETMVLASALGVLALGASHLNKQFRALGSGSLRAYAMAWQTYTRWSVMGVVLSELTANAHAYLVTFFAGPQAFAVLAVGSLAMRPVALVLTSLPDFERPRMAGAVAAGDDRQALRFVNEFKTAGGAIWLLTLGFAAVLLVWFPRILLRGRYDETQVLIVIAVWAVIMASRAYRTPASILLQSAGEFKPLASASTKSSIASLASTAVLLFAFGPLPALCGILIGELVMTVATASLLRNWRMRHG